MAVFAPDLDFSGALLKLLPPSTACILTYLWKNPSRNVPESYCSSHILVAAERNG